MDNYYRNEDVFQLKGYDIYFTRYADAILSKNLSVFRNELKAILHNFNITQEELLLPGGNKHIITKNLEFLLNEKKWKKKNVEDEHIVMKKTMVSQTHEIDHFCQYPNGNVAMEIDWNSKDSVYDRDLENFRKLHLIGAISVGIIITRAESMHELIPIIYKSTLDDLYPLTKEKLHDRYNISSKAQNNYAQWFDQPREELVDKISSKLIQSRFGESTTHMNKLLTRINRGLGNPCPMVLIGIGKERLII